MPDLQDELLLPPTTQVRRYMIRWCKRMGALLVLLAIAWSAWFLIARARLANELEQGRAGGFPTDINQLSPLAICEDPRATALYLRLANSVHAARYEYQSWASKVPGPWSPLVFTPGVPIPQTAPPPELSKAMALLEQIHAIPWPARGDPIRPPSTSSDTQRGLWYAQEFLATAATAAHLEHDDDKALLCIANTMRIGAIGSAVDPDNGDPSNISHAAADFLCRYLLDLKISSSPAAPTRGRTAIQQIIDHLAEGPETVHRREQWFHRNYTPAYGVWLGDRGLRQPRGMLAQAARNRAVRTAAVCCLAPSAPEAIAQFPPASRSDSSHNRTMWSLTMEYYTGIARQRIVRTMLAIALYRADHNALPESLNDLVPAYLPELPLDPFAADRKPLRYIPGAQAFTLYCIGPDDRDNRPASPAAVSLDSYPTLGVWISQTPASSATSPADTPTTSDSL